jgi:apolipoprotein N-acyltransferase
MTFEKIRLFFGQLRVQAAASGFLLCVIQPTQPFGFLAWGALFFLIRAVTQARDVQQAFRLGFLCGLFLFLPGLHWLQNVAFAGWLFAALFEALFIGLFAVLIFLGRRLEAGTYKLVWFAGSWLVCEWFRSEIHVLGLGWHLLAYSQSFYPRMIQCANLVGAYGLSFFIALANACLFLAWELKADPKQIVRSRVFGVLFLAVPLLVLAYGYYCLHQPVGRGEQLRIGLVQSNIPEDIKWRPEAKDRILEIQEKLTQLASFDAPDLTVWPEASFPGYFNRDPESAKIRELAVSTKTPILVGSPHYERAGVYYNSAYLVRGLEGDEVRYDKMRLVPFGEYVPFKFMFGWLMPLADAFGVGDFSAGTTYRLFRLYDDIAFGTLICFEDIFPRLAQEYVKRGAKFLVVMTNDSWFGRTAAPYQHLAASIFRAVENGVPVVRAANTGVSALISSQGLVTQRVSSAETGKDIFITGHGTGPILLTFQKTNYQKSGYMFPIVILMVMLNLAILLWLRKRVEKIRGI